MTGGVTMEKFLAAFVAAAIVAGSAVVVVPGLIGDVQASAGKVGVKGDRLDYRPTGTACSDRGWPYFESFCLRHAEKPVRQVKAVRVITTDRLPHETRPAIDRSLAMR